jgi:hypothetical protein
VVCYGDLSKSSLRGFHVVADSENRWTMPLLLAHVFFSAAVGVFLASLPTPLVTTPLSTLIVGCDRFHDLASRQLAASSTSPFIVTSARPMYHPPFGEGGGI